MTSTDALDELLSGWRRSCPELVGATSAVTTRLRRVAKILSDERDRVLTGHGVDAAVLELLVLLRGAGPECRLPVRELARAAMVTPAAISQRVARAERAGWVHRVPDEHDRRSVWITLTDPGRATVADVMSMLRRHDDDLLSDLSPAQLEALDRSLRDAQNAAVEQIADLRGR